MYVSVCSLRYRVWKMHKGCSRWSFIITKLSKLCYWIIRPSWVSTVYAECDWIIYLAKNCNSHLSHLRSLHFVVRRREVLERARQWLDSFNPSFSRVIIDNRFSFLRKLWNALFCALHSAGICWKLYLKRICVNIY